MRIAKIYFASLSTPKYPALPLLTLPFRTHARCCETSRCLTLVAKSHVPLLAALPRT